MSANRGGMKYGTRIVHAGEGKGDPTGAVSTPIYQVSTFVQKKGRKRQEYVYSRSDNPTRKALEEAVAELEGGVQGFAFSSGMAAIASIFLLLKTGDHIIAPADVYGGTFRVLTSLFRRWGLTHTFVDMTKTDEVEGAITPQTRMIFAETPSNPLLRITDLRAIAEMAARRNIMAVMDNTFMTPYLQRPFESGFHIVVHSGTKFLGGHSDVVAGLAVAGEAELADRIKQVQVGFGAILGPQDSWLLLRGLKTLAPRMETQQKTAERLALWLAGRPDVRAVHYPALPGHPGADIHRRQAMGGGAVLSFELAGQAFAQAFLRRLKLALFAVSLGGVETILSHPATMSHAAMPEKERLARGVTGGLVRLSVGLEDFEDLQQDIAQALKYAARTVKG